MSHQLINRYSFSESRFLQAMRLRVARSLVLLLSGTFLLVNSSFAAAKLHVDEQPVLSFSMTISPLDSQYDLNSTTLDGCELRAWREGGEILSSSKLKINNTCRSLLFEMLGRMAAGGFCSEFTSQSDDSHCDTPFPSRPPPFSAIQA